jgi:hypothetical protein
VIKLEEKYGGKRRVRDWVYVVPEYNGPGMETGTFGRCHGGVPLVSEFAFELVSQR